MSAFMVKPSYTREITMEKTIRCSCIGGEHYLQFTMCEGQIYVDILAHEKLPFKIKLREAWKLLTNKSTCNDGIILDREKSKEVVDFLTDYLKVV